MNEFPLRCLYIGLFVAGVFLRVVLLVIVVMKLCLQLLLNTFSFSFVKCALTVCCVQCMQKFLIKHSNEQECQQWARCFINTRDEEVKQAQQRVK